MNMNKRMLSLTLALVMVLGSLGSLTSVFAAEDFNAGEFLEDKGILEGMKDAEGNVDLKLEDNLARRDSFVLLARLMGENERDLEVDRKLFPTFVDKGGDEFYLDVYGWAEENNYVEGTDEKKIEGMRDVLAKEYALILMRALGYDLKGKDAWDTIEDVATEKGLFEGLEVTEDGKVTRGQVSQMTVNALHATLKDSETTLAEELNIEFPVPAELEVESVSAINAKTLEVTMNRAVSTEDQAKATIEAKRGSVKPSVKEIKFAEDNKSATIEFNAVMIAGDYTVTVSGLTEEALTGTVKVEAEKLTKIEFLSDVAVQENILDGDDKVTNVDLKMNVQAKNQYDEIVNDKLTASSVSITASKGASTGHSITKEGILTIKGNAADMFKVDDKVVLTIVDSETGVTATKTVTVVKSAQVETIELGELKTDDEELAKKPINVKNMETDFAKYYIPVEIKDQYGNVLKAAELKDVNVLSSNDNIIKLAGTKIVDLAKVGTVIKFQKPTTPTHGTAVLTVVAAGTGKTANTTVKVLENAKTDVLTVSTPEKALKLGVKVELPFTAVDQYGNDLVSNTELVLDSITGTNTVLKFKDGSSITTTGATIEHSVDYGNKNKVKLNITPGSENVVITAVSATGKAQTLNLKAEKAPAAASLGGFSKDIYNLIQKGQTQTISLDDIVINDQYGEEINLPAGFSLEFEAEDGSADKVGITNTTLDNSTTSTVLSADAKGTEVFEISLIDDSSPAKTLDTRTVTFETVELKDITTFGMKEVGKIFTGASTKYENDAADYAKALTIFGKKGSAEVKVDQGLLVSATATAPIEVSGSSIPHNPIETKGMDKTATLTGVVAGADNPLTITQTLTYNDAQSVITDLKVRKTGNEAEIKDGAIVVPANFIDGKKIGPVGANSTFQFYGEDQYGVAPKQISYTVTNVAKADKSAGPTIAISKAGVISVSGGSLVEGDTFTITGIVDGVVKTIKVIVGEGVVNTDLVASKIEVETLPTKVTYNDGEALDLTNLVVTVTYSNGVIEDIALANFGDNGITTDKANGATLATTDTKVVISVDGKSVNQAITVNPVFDNLRIKEAPTTTTYTSGEDLDLAGLEVELLSKDGTVYETVLPAEFADKTITVNLDTGLVVANEEFTISKDAKSVAQAITVNPIPVVLEGITANGTSGSVNTTELTLTFDVEPTGLAASDISVTGATKGTLTGTGLTRTLAINNITVGQGENVTVTIDSDPAEYVITPKSSTVAVNKAP